MKRPELDANHIALATLLKIPRIVLIHSAFAKSIGSLVLTGLTTAMDFGWDSGGDEGTSCYLNMTQPIFERDGLTFREFTFPNKKDCHLEWQSFLLDRSLRFMN